MKAALTSISIILAACAPLTPQQKADLQANAIKDAEAAGIGYLAGGKAGALAGLTGQVVKNHTSAKNPAKVLP